MDKNYLIIDIGTGNVRVAVAGCNGEVRGIERENIIYSKDELYPEALAFDPDELWKQIISLSKKVLAQFRDLSIAAITVSSQREGVVLVNSQNKSLLGLPNHDHRGRQWESEIEEKDYIYRKCGRYPNSIFSALKLVGLRKKRPEVYRKINSVLSISDWAQFKLSGVKGYEHSQASETLLYDVEAQQWSEKLCSLFNIDSQVLPPLHSSGKILGPLDPGIARDLNLSDSAVVIVGGSDTQLAIKSTSPALNDVVIVAGTTTPVVKLEENYTIDPRQKTWTNRHIEDNRFILETNAGVTGLNFQRLKEVFYPNEGYDIIEEELESASSLCMASLGSLIADEERPVTRGGFIFETPIAQNLTRADFVKGVFLDIACCITENYQYLNRVSSHQSEYIWGCGGGFQSKYLAQLLADLLEKEIRIREGFQHASIIGAVHVCNEVFEIPRAALEDPITKVTPRTSDENSTDQKQWKTLREQIKQTFTQN